MRCVATSEPSVSRTAARCLLAIALLMSAAAGPRATAAEPAAASPLVARAGGVTARICRWRDDKPAAFSLRFDDSRDSPFEIAPPPLEQDHLIQEAKQDSVGTDPGVCEITTTDAFQRRTDQIIAAGGWLSFYFHDVNVAQGMSIGEKPFREVIAHLGQKSRAWQAWVGGIAQVHKYETERDLATIAAELVAPLRVKITVDCAADARLYDEPLTVRVDFPRDAEYAIERTP